MKTTKRKRIRRILMNKLRMSNSGTGKIMLTKTTELHMIKSNTKKVNAMVPNARQREERLIPPPIRKKLILRKDLPKIQRRSEYQI